MGASWPDAFLDIAGLNGAGQLALLVDRQRGCVAFSF